MVVPRKSVYIFIGYLVLAFIAYGGNQGHTLLRWDDFLYITDNIWITDFSWEGVRGMFTEFRHRNWHPLTWLSYVPEYYFCGVRAHCYISVNIFIHGVNAFLLYLVSIAILERYYTDLKDAPRIFSAAAITGLLFVLHPQHTESVIWAAERKDVLYSLFYLLAMLSYIRSDGGVRQSATRMLPFVWYLFAIMSKSMAITLPIIFVLLDVLLLRRLDNASVKTWFRIIVLEKAHYYIITAILVLLTLLSQLADQMEQSNFVEKAYIVFFALQHYIYSFFYPVALLPFYPLDSVEFTLDITDTIFLILFIGMIIYSIRSRKWSLFFGYFLVSLLPVIGIVQVGTAVFADRYSYLPMAGFYIVVGYTFATFMTVKKWRYLVSGVLVILAVLMIINTRQYKEVWTTDLSLWSYIAKNHPQPSMQVYRGLAHGYFESGDLDKAVKYYLIAIEMKPGDAKAYVALAEVYRQRGDLEKIPGLYQLAIENMPDDASMYILAGDAFFQLEENQQAYQYYIMALEVDPDLEQARSRVGEMYYREGFFEKAIPILESIHVGGLLRDATNLLLAQAYLAIGDIEQSQSILKKVELSVGSEHEAVIEMKKLIGQVQRSQ